MHEDYSQDNEDDAKEDYSGSGDSEAGEIEDGSDMKYRHTGLIGTRFSMVLIVTSTFLIIN